MALYLTTHMLVIESGLNDEIPDVRELRPAVAAIGRSEYRLNCYLLLFVAV